jgi:hypothetical protein
VGVVVAVLVGVAVGVEVTVGVGVAVDVDGIGEGAAADVALGDGDGLAVVEEAAGAVVKGWPGITDAVAVGAGLVAGLLVAAPVVPAALGVCDRLARAASSECGEWEPPSARAATIPAEATAMTMPAAAATRVRTRSLLMGCLTVAGKPFGPNGPACSVTSCRYASVS